MAVEKEIIDKKIQAYKTLQSRWQNKVYEACKNNNLSELKELLKNKLFSINFVTKDNFQIFSYVISNNNADFVKEFLNRNDLRINDADIHLGLTPLMLAIRETKSNPEKIEIVKMLLNSNKLDINAKTKIKCNDNYIRKNALAIAIESGNLEVINEILKKDNLRINDNVYESNNKYLIKIMNAMHYTAKCGYKSDSDIVRCLENRKDFILTKEDYINFYDIKEKNFRKRYEQEMEARLARKF